MKKLLLFLFTISVSYLCSAQELGIRFGDVTGGNVAIDGIFATSDFSRIHANASFGNSSIGVDLLWDFLYKPLGESPMNWYAGVGPAVLLDNPLWISAVGELGVQYTLSDAPVSFSLDWRPTLTLIQTTDLYFGSFGLNVRYVFNK